MLEAAVRAHQVEEEDTMHLDPDKRAEQKAASRQADQERLESGEATAEQINEENSFIPRAMLEGARIVRHGQRLTPEEDQQVTESCGCVLCDLDVEHTDSECTRP